jgi:hypothetical protein
MYDEMSKVVHQNVSKMCVVAGLNEVVMCVKGLGKGG